MVKRVGKSSNDRGINLVKTRWLFAVFIILLAFTMVFFSGSNTVSVQASQGTGGATVSGIVKTYNPTNETKIQLMQGSVEVDKIIIVETVGRGQVEQQFSFSNVSPGTYSLAITKDAHTKFTVSNIVVADNDVDLTQNNQSDIQVMTLRCGDINGDGMIDNGDLSILWQKDNYNRKIGPTINKRCDLNGDKMVNDGDLTILWYAANYNKGEVVIDLAGGTANRYTVTFKDWNGAILDTQSVAHGTSAVAPVPSERNGYLFTGWDVSYQYITADTVITAVYAPADGLNFFSVTNADGKPGDIVMVTVSLGGTVKTCGFDMRLLYDNTALEYVGYNNENLNYLDVLAYHKEDEHMVRFNYSAASNRTSTAKVLDVSFRIKNAATSSTSLDIIPVEVIFADPQNSNAPAGIDYSLLSGTVTINE